MELLITQSIDQSIMNQSHLFQTTRSTGGNCSIVITESSLLLRAVCLAVPPLFTTLSWQPIVSPRTWNDLPDDVTSAESLSTFHQRLKTHLFTNSFFWLFPTLDFA